MSIVYIDGSARPVNGQTRSGFGIYWCDSKYSNLTCQGELDDATCARAEVMAMKCVLEQIYDLVKNQNNKDKFIIKCDNIYVVKGVNEWMNKWQREHYVGRAHADLWRVIHDCYLSIGHGIVTVQHVYAHKGEYGNEMADKLAKGEISAQQLPTYTPSNTNANANTILTDQSSVEPRHINSPIVTGSTNSRTVTRPGSGPSNSLGMTRPGTDTSTLRSTVTRPVAVSSNNGSNNGSKLDNFKSWLNDSNVTTVGVQHGQQLKCGQYKGGVTFYNTGTVLPQGLWWQQKWSEFSAA